MCLGTWVGKCVGTWVAGCAWVRGWLGARGYVGG